MNPTRKRRNPEWLFIYNDVAQPAVSKAKALRLLNVGIENHRLVGSIITLISKSMWKQEYVATDPITRKGYSIVACHKSVAGEQYSFALRQVEEWNTFV
jgi:hypothetical protein